jgi:glycosyltransferase involved in cell wall biosynthesis
MPALSVIICSHNPRPAYLARALDALRGQTLPQDRWELLLVDNATPKPLATAWDLSWHCRANHILEPELGLAAARRCGMRGARADLLVFLDDDNVIAPDYLAQALRIGSEYPSIGVFGSGSIIGEFEQVPPAHLRNYLRYLALREIDEPQFSRDGMSKRAKPWGAGLCTRAEIAVTYCESSIRSCVAISGRRGEDLVGGEDDEISIIACNMGFEIGIFPELKLTHLIPPTRISDQYLIKIREGLALTDLLLAYKWQGDVPRNPMSPRGLLALAKNCLVRQGIDRKMYLAYRRAVLKARRIIAESENRTGGPHAVPHQGSAAITR